MYRDLQGIQSRLISAGSAMQMGLAFSGLMVVGAMAIGDVRAVQRHRKNTTAWAHRGSQGG